MREKAPGKAFRKGITLKQIMRMFPDNETAYESLLFDHDTVKHSLSEYVRVTCIPTA